MIDITASVKETVKRIQKIPRTMESAALASFQTAGLKIKKIMQVPGLPVVYPIHWDSVKQRIFVILKLMEEDNLPYTRTDWHVKAWQSFPISNGYQVQNLGTKAVFLHGTVTGEMIGAVHVQPTGQSNIHAGRWKLIRPVINAVLSRLPEDILNEYRIEGNA